jgi:hypothetical protein
VLPPDRTPNGYECGEPWTLLWRRSVWESCYVIDQSLYGIANTMEMSILVLIGNIVNFQILGTPDAGRAKGHGTTYDSERLQLLMLSGGELLPSSTIYFRCHKSSSLWPLQVLGHWELLPSYRVDVLMSSAIMNWYRLQRLFAWLPLLLNVESKNLCRPSRFSGYACAFE